MAQNVRGAPSSNEEAVMDLEMLFWMAVIAKALSVPAVVYLAWAGRKTFPGGYWPRGSLKALPAFFGHPLRFHARWCFPGKRTIYN